MTPDGRAPAAATLAKRTAVLLRDARSVQRRVDTLAAAVHSVDDARLPLIAKARAAVHRILVELIYLERSEQQRARAAGRRIR